MVKMKSFQLPCPLHGSSQVQQFIMLEEKRLKKDEVPQFLWQFLELVITSME